MTRKFTSRLCNKYIHNNTWTTATSEEKNYTDNRCGNKQQ